MDGRTASGQAAAGVARLPRLVLLFCCACAAAPAGAALPAMADAVVFASSMTSAPVLPLPSSRHGAVRHVDASSPVTEAQTRSGRGLGLDLLWFDAGTLHLRTNRREATGEDAMPQWRLQQDVLPMLQAQRLWSLGLTLESHAVPAVPASALAHDPLLTSATRRRVLEPQLLLDADRLFGWHGTAILGVQRSAWVDRDSGRCSSPVMQLHLQWQF